MNGSREPMPAGFFGIAVGTLALAGAWRVGVKLWALPADLAALATSVALVVWLAVMAGYAHKWLTNRESALAEWRHPVQSLFLPLGPVSTLLAAQALLAWSRPLAVLLFVLGTVSQLALGVAMQGRFWQGGRKTGLVTPAIYLPTVAPSFVAGTTAAALGWTQLGELFFGVGVLSWFAIESVILHRTAHHDALPEALRPALGIQLAPPVVGGVTWLAISHGAPDVFAYALFGYGLYQALLLLRLLPWIRKQPFAPSYWAFSFGVAALPTMAMRLAGVGAPDWIGWLAVVLFIAANGVIGLLIVKTVELIASDRLLPARAAA
ncbi:dicarboxylate transporter/tellurite-resistance protein TehA [Paraburkholderia phosphatilytica]|uniref:dicarboxylate transporter/tellurite-resistance protein TehA n=1 Tax=Paraburkholderia phosphatilytica TaxID=2282883 RepID=UPI000E524E2D|nr:dicarboxylate transporter/tellurite-resistance protein TehA [Paraburkholderia phosphatilytica]